MSEVVEPAQNNTEPVVNNDTTAVFQPGAEAQKVEGTDPIVKDEVKVDEPVEDSKVVYEDFKMAEGTTLDEGLVGKLKDIAGASNMPQEAAQQLVDLAVEVAKQSADAMEAKLNETIEGWANETKADPEIGGANYEANLAKAGEALKRYGGEEFSKYLNDTGLGNHPSMVRTFLKIGNALSEDASTKAAPSAQATRTAAEILYG